MVRVMFLLAQPNRELRMSLVQAAVNGERWRVPSGLGKAPLVTEKQLVDLADGLTGWARSVYRFGCGYIHLSDLHDHQARDPFQALPLEEREAIAGQLNKYHGANLSAESTFVEVAVCVPRVLSKISTNLELYLRQLEEGGDLA
jgi:hypothetical protein